jgi:hypothetical protein
MSHHRLSASRVAHKSTGGTLQSLPEPVDPVANASDCLTSQTVAPPAMIGTTIALAAIPTIAN